jgi:hypothetical protein
MVFYKKWHILESNSNRIFITSDNPVSLIRPRNLPPFYGVGFLTGNIAVPFSPYRCLLLKNDENKKGYLKINKDYVNFFNSHTMFYAHKFIYSNLLSKDIENTFNKTKEGASERIIVN